jgi:pimeloyl-ACP methyl ester carboxylesterase
MSASAKPPPGSGGERDVDQYFTTDGARLRYRDEGRGPAVILVHGWTLDLEMWEPQVLGLCDAFRVIRLDRRGFGSSSGQPSPARDVLDIRSLCAHLAVERVALVGMSQGARAATGFALAAPQMISCVILDGPPGHGRKPFAADDDVPLGHYRALVRSQGLGAFRREWAKHPLLSLRTRDPHMRAILSAMINRYPGNDLLEAAEARAVPAAGPPIGAVDVPMLIITGDHDLASRTSAANRLAEQSPGAERAVIPEAGHLSNLDNPQAYNAVVRAFLERHAAPLFA